MTILLMAAAHGVTIACIIVGIIAICKVVFGVVDFVRSYYKVLIFAGLLIAIYLKWITILQAILLVIGVPALIFAGLLLWDYKDKYML